MANFKFDIPFEMCGSLYKALYHEYIDKVKISSLLYEKNGTNNPMFDEHINNLCFMLHELNIQQQLFEDEEEKKNKDELS